MAALENVTSNPKYRKLEMDYTLAQQRIAEALMFIESLPFKKEIKDKIVNTLATK